MLKSGIPTLWDSEKEKAKQWWRLPLASMLLLTIGTIVQLQVSDLTHLAKASETWPSVEGEIIRSEIKVRVPREPAWFERRPISKPYPYEVANIDYSYEVDGQSLIRERISAFGYPTGLNARQTAEQYPVGRKVDVYYNPNLVGESVLVRGTRDGDLPAMRWDIWMTLVGLVGLIFSVRLARRGISQVKG
jgi:hypothetical protein